jgi:hypothetical protein
LALPTGPDDNLTDNEVCADLFVQAARHYQGRDLASAAAQRPNGSHTSRRSTDWTSVSRLRTVFARRPLQQLPLVDYADKRLSVSQVMTIPLKTGLN